MRYIKQINSYSCGPTAVANIYRSLNISSPSIKTIQQQLWKIKKIKNKGTSQKSYVSYFRKKGFTAFRLKNFVSLKKIRELEKKNYKILISICFFSKDGIKSGHALTLIHSTPKGMYVTNMKNNKKKLKSKLWVSDKKLSKYLYSIVAVKS